MFRQIVADGDGGVENAVCLGITAAFVAARFEMPAHLICHQINDCVEALFFVGGHLLLGQRQAFVFTPQADEELDEFCGGFAQQPIQRAAKKGF